MGYKVPIHGRELIAKFDESAFLAGDSLLQLAHFGSHFAQFTLPRQNAGLGVMTADGQSTIRFQQFSTQRDKSITAGMNSHLTRGFKIANNNRMMQKLRGKTGQSGIIRGNQFRSQRDESFMSKNLLWNVALDGFVAHGLRRFCKPASR